MTSSVPLVIGNTYERIYPDHAAKWDRSRTMRKVHDWVLYVDVPATGKEIIDRVTFRLGPSFEPNDYVRHSPIPSPDGMGWRYCTRQQTYCMDFGVKIEVKGRGGSIRTYVYTLCARSFVNGDHNFIEPRRLQPIRLLKLAPYINFGVELELTSDLSAREIAAYYDTAPGPKVVVVDGYRQGRETMRHWKFVPDSSIQCGTMLPSCHTFELVSPILQGGSGLSELHQVLQTLDGTHGKIAVNNSMGFHVHVDVSGMHLPQLIKICQTFLKYEAVMDTFFPADRRSSSPQAQRYFQSHKTSMRMMQSSSTSTNRRRHAALAMCTSLEDLVDLWSPDKYYKLNLQNLITGRQPTIEFRQHHATADYETVGAWVRFCIAMVTNAAALAAPKPLHPSRTVDEAFTLLFAYCIKDQALEEFYTKRRILAERECCSSCAGGRGCRRA
jgi:hypothetical protein